MDQINNPHDKFFKEVFARRDTAEEFLRNYLPGEVARLLDWSSLESAKDTIVDKRLKEYFSDLLFKAHFQDGSWGYVYILFEHKSYQTPLTAFHLLRYMVRIWERSLEEKEERRWDPSSPIFGMCSGSTFSIIRGNSTTPYP